jgi:hypothetical protein
MGMNMHKALGVAAMALVLAGGEAMAQDWDGSYATDFDLEMVAYAAYNGAREYALTHDNYFMWRGSEFPDLRDSIIEGLKAEGYEAATVGDRPTSSIAAAIECGAEGQTDVRIRPTSDGAGILLVAVTADRMAAYEYDPEKSADIIITYPQDCGEDLAQAGDPVGQGPTPPEDEPTVKDEPIDDEDVVDITPEDEQPEDQPEDEPTDDEGDKGKNKDKG